ncbi:MAG: hypothetical protein KGI33_05005 [Thaumarchaeota archaeon]|nr:hypothetical protein [Nitrososphaerota archaeon]
MLRQVDTPRCSIQVMGQRAVVECTGCGSMRAVVAFVPAYHGFRGACPDCGADWPES